MKRHTRSSKQSTGEGSQHTGERSTRSSSSDLITINVPRPSRNRRTLSAENKDTKNEVANKRHPSGSKHRTRSQSGHSHLPDDPPPAKVSRRASTSQGNSSRVVEKDHPQGNDTGNLKKSSKHVPAKEMHLKGSQHKSVQMSEHNRHAPRAGNPHSTRTRNHSGKNIGSEEPRGDQDQIRNTAQFNKQATRHGAPHVGNNTTTQSQTPAVTQRLQPPEIQQYSQRADKKGSRNSSDLTRPQLKGGDSEPHNLQPADIQEGPLTVGTVPVRLATSPGVVVNIPERVKVSDSSKSKLKVSPPISMQAGSKVNHLQASPDNPARPHTAVKNKLEKRSHKKKRHKSSSRNLAPEFGNSLEEMSTREPLVGEDPRTVGMLGNSGEREDPSPISVTKFPDVTVPTGPSNRLAAVVDTASSREHPTSVGLPDCHERKVSEENQKGGSASPGTGRADLPRSVQNQKHDREKELSSKPSNRQNFIDKSIHSNNLERNINSRSLHEPSTSNSVPDSGANSGSLSAGSRSTLASTSTPLRPDGAITADTEKREVPADTKLGEQKPQGDTDYQALEWGQDVSESEPFYFESDHLALKGNKDYRMLLRTLTTLEAQRRQATLDLEALVEKQKQALTNPISFVNKIQHNVDLQLPLTQRVVPLPEVNWETYLGKPENSELLQTVANQKVKTRPSNAASAPSASQQKCHCCNKAGTCSKTDQHCSSTSGTSSAKAKATTDPKSQTFNQPWTSDEQRKLEELLIKYPMESVEARRWEKIAKALGNRTPLQVASRVQKYFIKLTRAGIPVPGRLPHATQLVGRRGNRRGYSFMRPNIPSTFLQSVVPPVFMNDNDSWDSFDSFNDDEELSDDESIPAELRETDEYKELKRLRQMKNEKMRQQAQMTHLGFQCDRCGVEPIVGTRWHCSDCPSSTSTDLCQKCMDKDDYQSVLHTASHHLEPIRFKMEATYIDSDYTRFQQQLGAYNYLDPNYTPLHKPDYNL